jgi:hypothetical protein
MGDLGTGCELGAAVTDYREVFFLALTIVVYGLVCCGIYAGCGSLDAAFVCCAGNVSLLRYFRWWCCLD